MKTPFWLFLIAVFIAPHVLAGSAPSYTDADEENVSHQSSILESFLESYLVRENLALSIAIIENEMSVLRNKPIRLSDKQINSIKGDLVARFHPEEIKKTLLVHLQQAPENTQQDFVSLQETLSTPIAVKLASSRKEALKPTKQNEALDYQEKLLAENVQQHRVQIARTYDGLQKFSIAQALLFQTIQNSIYKNLSEKHRSRYKKVNQSERLKDVQDFNQALNLYAFKQVPAEDFIVFFDSIASPSSQKALAAYEEYLKKALDERAELKIIIEND